MKLTVESLPRQLRERLLPVYLVSGDEPLLVTEALDAIRARARASGFEEREQVFIDRTAAVWENALGSTQSRSLFASRRILEIRLGGAKPGHGAPSLLKLIATADEDLLLLIVASRLDREAASAPWVLAAQERGAWLAVSAPTLDQFPDWLRGRLQLAGLEVSNEALQLLAASTEGNLLAAQQEIAKLALLYPAGSRLGLQQLADACGESARYDVQELQAAVAARDAARALRILAGLRTEGDEPVRVLWWLLRSLHGQGGGGTIPMARLIARAARVDRVAKGQAHGDAWDGLALLAAEMCGKRTLPLPRQAAVWERARA